MTDIKFSGNLLEQAYFNETLNSERLRVTILDSLPDNFKSLGAVNVKGREEPISLYKLA